MLLNNSPVNYLPIARSTLTFSGNTINGSDAITILANHLYIAYCEA